MGVVFHLAVLSNDGTPGDKPNDQSSGVTRRRSTTHCSPCEAEVTTHACINCNQSKALLPLRRQLESNDSKSSACHNMVLQLWKPEGCSEIHKHITTTLSSGRTYLRQCMPRYNSDARGHITAIETIRLCSNHAVRSAEPLDCEWKP